MAEDMGEEAEVSEGVGEGRLAGEGNEVGGGPTGGEVAEEEEGEGEEGEGEGERGVVVEFRCHDSLEVGFGG